MSETVNICPWKYIYDGDRTWHNSVEISESMNMCLWRYIYVKDINPYHQDIC